MRPGMAPTYTAPHVEGAACRLSCALMIRFDEVMYVSAGFVNCVQVAIELLCPSVGIPQASGYPRRKRRPLNR